MAELSVKNIVMEWFLGSTADIAGQIGHLWGIIRASFLAPMLTVSLYICLVMSTMLFIEWLYIGVVIVYVKLFRRKPQTRYKWEPMQDDSETGNAAFPMVLVQIPLFNENEVCKLSIGAACKLSWPADRLLIQVLSGSTDILIKEMVEKECARRAIQGINIRYQSRETRGGFKAGALKEGLEYERVKDASMSRFSTPISNRNLTFSGELSLFSFTTLILPSCKLVGGSMNAECLLTRLQEMSLDYHFIVKQEVGSSVHAFFGFNGSAGISRIAAINEAGGWDDRTTAEDMDLAVRVGLKGWKLVFDGTLQQVSLWKKVYMIYSFFFVRKIVGHTCIFFSYCVVLPLTILIPEVDVPKGGAVFIPCIITAINVILATPRSLHLVILWILFECIMSIHMTKAIFTCLLGGKSANEWLVTQKLGDTTKNKSLSESNAPKESRFKVLRGTILLPELGFAMFLFISRCYGFLYREDYYFIYLFLQAITITIVGLGFIGKILPSC